MGKMKKCRLEKKIIITKITGNGLHLIISTADYTDIFIYSVNLFIYFNLPMRHFAGGVLDSELNI